jgi:hypothetical protein
MRIARNSTDTLLLKEETVWISVVCGIAAGFIFFQGATHRAWAEFVAGLLFAAFGLVFLRTTRVRLDRAAREVTIERMRIFQKSVRRLAFGDIDDVVIETSAMSDSRTAVCRLAFVTRAAIVPLTDVYSGTFRRYDAMRIAVLQTLNKPVPDPLQQSLHHLLKSHRTLDAIVLLRTHERTDLATARERVARMERDLGASLESHG